MTQFPTWAGGQRVLAPVLTQMEPLWAIKGAATLRASTVAVAADPDLAVVLPGAGTFAFELFLNYTGGTLGSSDLKMAMVFGGTSSFGVWGVSGINTSATTQVNQAGNALAVASTIVVGTNGGNFLTCGINGSVFATTGGTLSLQWAQNTVSTTSTALRQGCWMRASQLA